MAVAVIHDGLSMMERFNQTGSFMPRGVKCCINGEMITYAALKAERIKRQAEHLKRITAIHTERRAGFLWTFYQPGLFGFAFAGWWAYLRICGHEDHKLRWDIIGAEDKLVQSCMELFPCGVFPLRENFSLWMEEFGRQYRRPGRFKDQGLAPVWVTYAPGNRMEVEKP